MKTIITLLVTFASVGASASLLGAPSCCASPVRGDAVHAQAATPLRMVLASYEKVSNALAADDLAAAQSAAQTFVAVADITGIDLNCPGALSGCEVKSGQAKNCTKSLEALIKAEDLKGARVHFKAVSAQAIALASTENGFYVMHCPMAGKNAEWLQSDPEIRNPYHGSAMLGCGVIKSGGEA
jgi:membrane fusion protein, copper/silver efflux system